MLPCLSPLLSTNHAPLYVVDVVFVAVVAVGFVVVVIVIVIVIAVVMVVVTVPVVVALGEGQTGCPPLPHHVKEPVMCKLVMTENGRLRDHYTTT